VRARVERYSRFAVWSLMVTGPSFTSYTFLSAPNLPVATGRPDSRSSA
jgi:hypothetical protein